MKNKYFKIIGSTLIVGTFLFLAFGSENSKKDENSYSTNEPKEKINCITCGKDLTDDSNRISPNGNSYYCTAPCYQQLKREVSNDLESEGYNRIDN